MGPRLPTLQSTRPPQLSVGGDQRAWAWAGACKQGVLSGLPGGICVFVGSAVERARPQRGSGVRMGIIPQGMVPPRC